jgi:DNA-binding transcriptional MerR regulator
MEIDENKLYPVGQVAQLIKEPVYVVRMWTEMYNIPVTTKSKSHRNYWRYNDLRKLIKIKRCLRELRLSHDGVRNVLYQAKRMAALEKELGYNSSYAFNPLRKDKV